MVKHLTVLVSIFDACFINYFAPFVLKMELSELVPGREIDNRKVHYRSDISEIF